MWDLVVLIPDHCLSVYFTMFGIGFEFLFDQILFTFISIDASFFFFFFFFRYFSGYFQ